MFWGMGLQLIGQDGAGKRLEFEVASVRENKSDERNSSNFPLNPGPQFGGGAEAVGGVLRARHMPLMQYVVFAYKPASWQMGTLRQGMPGWARELSFDIDARAKGSPSKDEMRAMMQALLEERFGMKVHRESREMGVFLLELAKEGKTGPRLRPHPADDPECRRKPLAEAQGNGYPHQCGTSALIAASAPGLTAISGQNVTMENFVLGLTDPSSEVNRPVVNRTGLQGGWDFTLEWVPGGGDPAAGLEASGPGMLGALREQLGLKLVQAKGPVEMIVVDRVERLVGN